MLLYSSSCTDFYEDVETERIEDKLTAAFKAQMGHQPIRGERLAWKHSLTSLHFAAKRAGLSDQGVIVEYELPQTSKRLDVMFTGADERGADSATVIELKQWEKCEPADGEHVVTWVGGGDREVLHPSVQVGQYVSYLEGGQSVFHEGDPPVAASGSAYLHNYRFVSDDPLLEAKFNEITARCPIYTKDDQRALIEELERKVGAGPGNNVLQRVLDSSPKPSKKLLESTSRMLDGNDEYVLLDEQLVAFDRVIAEVRRALAQGTSSTVLIVGGPGTGKSVIALNLIAALSADGHNAKHATGSKAFTETIKKIVGKDAAQQFHYFNQFATSDPGSIDVLVCDEAHRIRNSSVDRFTKKDKRSGKRQVEELLDVARVAVFFIDDLQTVRHLEVGSTELVREAARERDRRFFEYKLRAQFRCAGSDGYVNWVTNTLGLEDTANQLWPTDEDFDFRIVDSPDGLEEMIRAKDAEDMKARLMAGYCWPWSDPVPEGGPGDRNVLIDDVVVGGFSMPWNAKPDATRLAKGVPKSHLWAYEAGGIDQVGCIYTAQGFEFDYAGVIFGPDLVYREDEGGWIARLDESHDRLAKTGKESFASRVKNTYRVLLTRGMKGCYVYFCDEETRKYWESRME